MTAVAVPPRPALVVIPNVPILEVGDDWPMMTGPATLTPEDLQAAIDAQGDPSLRSPILKLGHGGDMAGMPAFGRLQNLRLAANGMSLVADIVGAPAWLADVLPYAWPSRSFEGRVNVTTETGRTHALVVDALALLGVELPAISTLDDVRAIYTAETMEAANVTLAASRPPRPVVAASIPFPPMPRQTSLVAGVTTEDVRREYYETLPQGSWWWIREIQLDPLTLIVDDDNGSLWSVAVTITDPDTMTFADPVEVRVEYVPVPPDTPADVAASRVVFASRAASRGARMDPIALRQSLGMADDATDEAVTARIAELVAGASASGGATPPAGAGAEPATPTGTAPTPPAPTNTPAAPAPSAPPASAAVPDGTVLVDAGQWATVQSELAAGRADREQRAREAENAFIARQRAAGRLGPATNPNSQRLEAGLRREWQRNQGEAEAFAASLAEVVPVAERGHSTGADSDGGMDAAIAAMFFPKEG